MSDLRRPHWGVAWALVAVGLAVVAALAARRLPALAPRPPVVDLGPTTIAVLDTIPLAERTVLAQLDAVVTGVDAGERRVWVEDRGRTLEVELSAPLDTAGLRAERRVLVTGQLRGDGGRRWLDAEAWTLVEGVAVPPAPDSARFGPPPDRSAAAGDRSPPAR